MKNIDAVRGLRRDILFDPDNRYARSGANPLSNCVVEAVELDHDGRVPALSLRFYFKPEGGSMEEGTEIGIEMNLGLDMADSLVRQINEKWPELLKIAKDQESEI